MPAAKTTKERALALLARGEKTAHQLRESLLRHAQAAEVDSVLKDLARLGLQSDERAALGRANRSLLRGHAAERASQELVHAGVDSKVAALVVDTVYAGQGAQHTLEQQAKAKLPAHATLEQRQKVARALVRQGHDPEQVRVVCGLDEDGV